MAYSINKVILVGNVGNDPELKTFQSGDKVINFSIATSESWRDKASGEQKSITEWHKVAIFNTALVEIADKFIKNSEINKYPISRLVDKFLKQYNIL